MTDDSGDGDEGDSRQLGVELGPLADELRSIDYPIEKSDLVAEYGDRDLGLENESPTLRETIGPMGDTTFQSADEVERTVIGMVGDDAIGRKGYSDRGGERKPDDRSDESV